MRILFTRFPLESAHGGAENQTMSLIKGLSERGHAVAFLGSCPALLESTEKAHVLNAHLEIGPPPVSKWTAISFFWRKKNMQKKLETAINEFGGVDAIFMLSLSEKLLLTDTAVKKGIKVFWVEHDRVGPWLRKNPWFPTLRALSRKVMTICVSELSRKIYLGLGWNPEKTIAIPNGIDLTRFETKDSQPSTRNPQLRLGCVARLSPEKGVDLLVQAVAKIPEAELTIVGTGPDENYVRQLMNQIHAAEMMDRERVRIVHKVDDVESFYRSIDALVLPSRDNDPFGLVVAEAMACGTPVIVTDQCGVAGYLRDGTDAVIVKADSADTLVDGIRRMKDKNVHQQLSVEGLRTVREKFTVERMVDMYERVL